MQLWGKLDRSIQQEQQVDAIVKGKLAEKLLKGRDWQSDRHLTRANKKQNRYHSSDDDSDADQTAECESSCELSGSPAHDSGIPGISEDALNLISDMEAPSRSYIAEAHKKKTKQIQQEKKASSSRRRRSSTSVGVGGNSLRRRESRRLSIASTSSSSSRRSSRRSSAASIAVERDAKEAAQQDQEQITKNIQVISLRAGIRW